MPHSASIDFSSSCAVPFGGYNSNIFYWLKVANDTYHDPEKFFFLILPLFLILSFFSNSIPKCVSASTFLFLSQWQQTVATFMSFHKQWIVVTTKWSPAKQKHLKKKPKYCATFDHLREEIYSLLFGCSNRCCFHWTLFLVFYKVEIASYMISTKLRTKAFRLVNKHKYLALNVKNGHYFYVVTFESLSFFAKLTF